jgi:hypothetical protein
MLLLEWQDQSGPLPPQNGFQTIRQNGSMGPSRLMDEEGDLHFFTAITASQKSICLFFHQIRSTRKKIRQEKLLLLAFLQHSTYHY